MNMFPILFFIAGFLTYPAYSMDQQRSSLDAIPVEIVKEIVSSFLSMSEQNTFRRCSKRCNTIVETIQTKEFDQFKKRIKGELYSLIKQVKQDSKSDAEYAKKFRQDGAFERIALLRHLSNIIKKNSVKNDDTVLKEAFFILRYMAENKYDVSKVFRVVPIGNNIGSMNGDSWFDTVPYVQAWPLAVAVQQENIHIIKLLLYSGFVGADEAKSTKNETIIQLLNASQKKDLQRKLSLFRGLKNIFKKK